MTSSAASRRDVEKKHSRVCVMRFVREIFPRVAENRDSIRLNERIRYDRDD